MPGTEFQYKIQYVSILHAIIKCPVKHCTPCKPTSKARFGRWILADVLVLLQIHAVGIDYSDDGVS
jgi:hypothetical protein